MRRCEGEMDEREHSGKLSAVEMFRPGKSVPRIKHQRWGTVYQSPRQHSFYLIGKIAMWLPTKILKTSVLTGALSLVAIALGFQSHCQADDWSGWMGDHRDGVYRESGIVEEIPAAGLPVRWRVPISGGYAGPAVAAGRVFVFDYQIQSGDAFNDADRRANVMGKERLTALDARTGEEIWRHQYECPYNISYPAGPRCTPTVDGDRVYTLGSEGDLHCLNVSSGEVIWHRSLPDDLSAKVPTWGFASHPLVEGELLYTMVGGTGQGIVAFDKMSGEVRWKMLDTVAGYCPPSIIEFAGVRQLIAYHPLGIDSLEPLSGKLLWHMDIEPLYEMSVAMPMREGNRLYASGIRTAAVMMELDEETPDARALWRGQRGMAVYCNNSTPQFVGGVIYGTDCNEGNLIAVDAENGERLWTTFQATRPDEKRFIKHGTAFITRIGNRDRYLLFSEIGDLIMARMTRSGYEELGRFHALEPSGNAFGRDVVWSHPAYANRTAYMRNDQEIIAVSLEK